MNYYNFSLPYSLITLSAKQYILKRVDIFEKDISNTSHIV